MTASLPVIVTPRAAKHIREADEWWRRNRTAARTSVWQEVERVFLTLRSEPRIGSRARDVKLSGVQRILLPAISYYLYYRVLGQPDRIEVLALWHRRRGSGPPL